MELCPRNNTTLLSGLERAQFSHVRDAVFVDKANIPILQADRVRATTRVLAMMSAIVVYLSDGEPSFVFFWPSK